MFDVNEILAALRSGTSSDDLAAQMTDALNLANKTYKTELEEAKKKAEEERLKKVQKVNDLADIIDYLLNWVKCYYDDVDIPEDTDSKEMAKEVIDTVDKFGNLFGNYDFHSLLSASDGKTTKTVKNTYYGTADSMINDFLHELGL